MNKAYVNKPLAVAVIFLFIGVTFAPSINANVSKESELVEFTTEVCGLNGGKHTVQLTKAEAKEVDILFDSIRERLNTTESREEAEEIFKGAVVELDKYGLLGGLNVIQVKKLVTRQYQNLNRIRFFDEICNRNQLNNNADFNNYICLLLAHFNGLIGDYTVPLFTVMSAIFFSIIFFELILSVHEGPILFFIISKCDEFLMRLLAITWKRADKQLLHFMSLIQTIYSKISIFSIGLNGIKAGDKTLNGHVRFDIWGFTGLKILVEKSGNEKNAYYLGGAIALKGPYYF